MSVCNLAHIYNIKRDDTMSRRNVAFKTITASDQVLTTPCFFCGMIIAPTGVGDPAVGVYNGVSGDHATTAKMVFPEKEYDGSQKFIYGGLPGLHVRCSDSLWVYISGNVTVTVYYSV